MADARRTAGLGIGAAVAVLVLLVVPYLVVDGGAVGVYYGGDLVGPPLAGLFAAVAAIALAGAARGRTDPAMAAGVAVGLGALVAWLLGTWAVGVSPSMVGGLTTVATFEWHRWALAAAGLALLGGAAWFARTAV